MILIDLVDLLGYGVCSPPDDELHYGSQGHSPSSDPPTLYDLDPLASAWRPAALAMTVVISMLGQILPCVYV